MSSDVRGDLAPELHFLPMIPRLSRMALYSPTGKTHSGSLSFHPYPMYSYPEMYLLLYPV